MSFKYNSTKKYTLTEDMTDIENWVGCRVPMLMKKNKDEDRETAEKKVVKWLYFSATFNNTWKALGATDTFQKPTTNGFILYTALQGDKVLKQTLVKFE
jgi:hypothetical protein